MKPQRPRPAAPGALPGSLPQDPARPPASAAPPPPLSSSLPHPAVRTPPRGTAPHARTSRPWWSRGARGCRPDAPAAPTPGRPGPDSPRGAAGRLPPLPPPPAPPARRRGLGSTSRSGGRGASGDPGAGSAGPRPSPAPGGGREPRGAGRGSLGPERAPWPEPLPLRRAPPRPPRRWRLGALLRPGEVEGGARTRWRWGPSRGRWSPLGKCGPSSFWTETPARPPPPSRPVPLPALSCPPRPGPTDLPKLCTWHFGELIPQSLCLRPEWVISLH